MGSWQADFYHRPLQDQAGKPLWELVLCDANADFLAYRFCPQAEANAQWLTDQLKTLIEQYGVPEEIHVFRPQIVSMLEAACQPLGIPVIPTRRTTTLKHWLRQRATQYAEMEGFTREPYNPVKLEQLPPLPLPESLWGDRWRFAAIAAADLLPAFQDRPIPICSTPEFLNPMNLGLASSVLIPGVVIDGGRQSMRLARWLQEADPVSLHYIPGEPDGLILQAGLVDRWVIATFTDEGAIAAGKTFRDRLVASRGLHFLLVQPDDTGITYSGFWLLQDEGE